MNALRRLPSLAWTLALLMLAVGIGVGIYIGHTFIDDRRLTREQRDFADTYKYIDPLLACGDDQNLDEGEAKRLQQQMQNSIDAHKNAGDVKDVAVYLRDIHGGPWVGINYERPFSPGSLLKVPLAISVYKQAEQDRTLLQKELSYSGQETADIQYFPPTEVPAGKYTVEKMVELMLTTSNNNAASELANYIGVDSFEATYQHLGVKQPPAVGVDYTTTTRDYASFFRVLFNGTYLTSDDSEHLLEILTHSSFRDGLVAGVPPEVEVAHKFGERTFGNSNLLQLHDCGIVYAPSHPYIICVMTQGTDFRDMARTIADISSLAYNYIQ